MALPEPKPGLIDYLWSQEAARGREQGKDRPACLVAVSDAAAVPRFVVILPTTHTAPAGDTVGIEIPPRVRLPARSRSRFAPAFAKPASAGEGRSAKAGRAIGLDDAPCWAIVSEHNGDEWPNAGVMPVPGRPGTFGHGFIPPRLFAAIKARFLELSGQRRGATPTPPVGTRAVRLS